MSNEYISKHDCQHINDDYLVFQNWKWKVSQTFHFSWMCVAPATLHILPRAPNNGKDLLTFILNNVPDHLCSIFSVTFQCGLWYAVTIWYNKKKITKKIYDMTSLMVFIVPPCPQHRQPQEFWAIHFKSICIIYHFWTLHFLYPTCPIFPFLWQDSLLPPLPETYEPEGTGEIRHTGCGIWIWP